MSCSKKPVVLVSTVLVVALAVALAWAISLRARLEGTQRAAKMQAQASERNIAEKDRTIANLKRRLDQMTKRYEEEYADRAAVMDYLAGIQRKMDFAHPFGFSLRDKVEKSRILPTGIYIRDGDYEKFETGHMLVDRDTMAFAKISGVPSLNQYAGKRLDYRKMVIRFDITKEDFEEALEEYAEETGEGYISEEAFETVLRDGIDPAVAPCSRIRYWPLRSACDTATPFSSVTIVAASPSPY